MNPKESNEPRLQINQIVLLVAAVTGGVWLYQGPLKSSRPVHSEDGKRNAPVVDLRVEARLWLDPFEAVDFHIKIDKSAKQGGSEQGPIAHSHQLQDVTAELADSIPQPGHVHVLAVLADGSPHAESRESRLRQRFAVLSGLERAGYTPVDSEHIRFFQWTDETFCQGTFSDQQVETSLQISRSNSTKDVKTSISVSSKSSCSPAHAQAGKYEYWRQAPVPVEWYRSEETKSDVLVFWIKDQDLGNRPTKSLKAIQDTVLKAFLPFRLPVSFKVIGPRFSGTLQAMIDEIGMTQNVEFQDALLIYSPWSTAPEDSLTRNGQSVAERLAKIKTTFIRTIPTDEQLIDALFQELERRGLAFECESAETCNHIAVIAEWDTLYGRTLPDLVQDKALKGIEDGFKRRMDTKKKRIELVHRYSYLRGLDGELPQAKSQDDSATSSGNTVQPTFSPKDRRQDIARMERPEGRSQLDYVRQLTELIREKEENIRADCSVWKMNCPGFRAIGVLGSDVYDKLLIMQALKKSFPHVIFFTTDLDARLFHASESAWTRNLVVASHFDLKLNEQLQYTIPPFRDTYQTATFFTILRALDSLKESDACPKKPNLSAEVTDKLKPSDAPILVCFEDKIRTKLHEIGRNGPVDISATLYRGDEERGLQTINTVRPAPVKLSEALTKCAYVVAILLLVWILLLPASAPIANWSTQLLTKSAASPAQAMIGLLVFASLLAMALRYLISDSYEGEPFSLFDGISIWLSQILRGMVVALSLLFLGWIYNQSNLACEKLANRFSVLKDKSSDAQDRSSLASGCSCILTMWDRMNAISIWGQSAQEEIHTVWMQYRDHLSLTRISLRVGFWTLVCWGIGNIALGIAGMPVTPFRGEVASQVNSWLLPLAVLGMLAVIFLVLDVNRLTSVFVEKLIPKDLKGPSNSDELMTHLRIIAHLTKQIDTFIYFPAGLIALMLLARSDYIDNWDFPIGLTLVVGLSTSYVIVSAFQLRWATERARQRVLDALSFPTLSKSTRVFGIKKENTKDIRQVIDEVKGLTEGAFMPLTHLPVFQVVTLPTGFYALFALIETLINN